MAKRGSSWETFLELGIGLLKAFKHLFSLKMGGFNAYVWMVLLLNVAYLA
jgi:hypothetical protein